MRIALRVLRFGTVQAYLQSGHWSFFPAIEDGLSSFVLHFGHLYRIIAVPR